MELRLGSSGSGGDPGGPENPRLTLLVLCAGRASMGRVRNMATMLFREIAGQGVDAGSKQGQLVSEFFPRCPPRLDVFYLAGKRNSTGCIYFLVIADIPFTPLNVRIRGCSRQGLSIPYQPQ